MKTKNKLLVLASTLIISANINSAFGQVTNPTNAISAGNYVGSSNTNDVVFKSNGAESMRILQSNQRVGIGTTTPGYLLDVSGGDINVGAATSLTNGYYLGTAKFLWNGGVSSNVFLGPSAGTTGTGTANVCIGGHAGEDNTSGTANQFIGYNAGLNNTKGGSNVFIGDFTAGGNTTAGRNVAIGPEALGTQSYDNSNTAWQSYNVAVGSGALRYNQPTSTSNGINNTALGANAGYQNTTGTNNVFLGYQSGYSNAIGGSNVFSGYQSGYGNTTAGENVAIGYEAMKTQSYGSTAYITYNVALGYQALYSNQPNSQANATGTANTAIGHQALYTNGIGYQNTALGQGALYTNSSGNNNTAVGQSALYYNTAGNNTAIGFSALLNNTSGSYNTANGYQALRQNATGQYNTASGYQAGYNTTGSENIYSGYQAGYANTSGSKNTALGNLAGYSNTTGSNNTCVGYGADVNANNLSNATALGNGAVSTGNNIMYLGNANALIYCAVGNWSGSDGRFKTNVKEEVKGLEFINRLRPVTYQFDTKMLTEHITQNIPDSIRARYVDSVDFTTSKSVVRSGFIAQEVEQASIASGYVSDIVQTPKSNADHYALNYAEFVVPLVKAVQEQQAMIENLQSEITTLKGGGQRNNNNNNDDQGHKEATNSIELANNSQPILYQNEPNPFDGSTVIRYFIPENVTGSTFVVFYDMYGKEVNKLELKEHGFGKIEANTENLASGIYSYSIVVDGKSIDTKKMLKSK